MSQPNPSTLPQAQNQTTQSGSQRDPRYEHWRWRIFGVTWLAYAGFYLTRKSFSVAKNALKDPAVLGMTKGEMSWIEGANSVAYAIGQFCFGTLGDKLGTRIVILGGMLASVLTAVAMGMSSTVVMMAVLFGIQGLCQSTGWAPLSKNMAGFFSRRERGTIMGFWCT